MGHSRNQRRRDPAATAFLGTLLGAYACSFAVIGLYGFLISQLLTAHPSLPVPSQISFPFALTVLHVFVGFVAFFIKHVKSPRKFYVFVALCDFVLFEAMTYTAVGTFAGINAVDCAAAPKAGEGQSLMKELAGVPQGRTFTLQTLMGLDFGTCAEAKAGWALLLIGGIANLLAAVAAYFMHDRQRHRAGNGGGGGYQGGGGYGGSYMM